MLQGMTPLAPGMRALAIDVTELRGFDPPPQRVDLILASSEPDAKALLILRQLPVLVLFTDPPALVIQAAPDQAERILQHAHQGLVLLRPAEESLVARVCKPSAN